MNASGAALVYCGYIGGSGDDMSDGGGIAVDGSGNAYITGSTSSTEATFPVTVGPDLTYNGGDFDTFVAKVNASGAALLYCGYISGGGYEWGSRIAVDDSGNAYITGSTSSTEAGFPVIGGPDLTYNGGTWDVFIAKIFDNESSSTLMVTSPAGGEAWIIGATQGISWLSTGVSGNLNINLYKGTSNLGAIATGIPISNGVYNWKAGYLKNGTRVAAGNTYRVSIVSALNRKITAISNAYFSLVKPKISVKMPVNGTTWKFNSSQRITWTYSAVSGTVNIFLYRYGVLKGQVATSVLVGDLGFSWTVGALTTGKTVPVGAGYSVKVTTSDGKVSGKSPGTFTIRR